jgi:hypothetical protein
MPPVSPPPQTGIKWNEVTWYSKLGAIVLFVGVIPALSFYIGMQYQAVRTLSNASFLNEGVTANTHPAVSDATPTYGFSFEEQTPPDKMWTYILNFREESQSIYSGSLRIDGFQKEEHLKIRATSPREGVYVISADTTNANYKKGDILFTLTLTDPDILSYKVEWGSLEPMLKSNRSGAYFMENPCSGLPEGWCRE